MYLPRDRCVMLSFQPICGFLAVQAVAGRGIGSVTLVSLSLTEGRLAQLIYHCFMSARRHIRLWRLAAAAVADIWSDSCSSIATVPLLSWCGDASPVILTVRAADPNVSSDHLSQRLPQSRNCWLNACGAEETPATIECRRKGQQITLENS